MFLKTKTPNLSRIRNICTILIIFLSLVFFVLTTLSNIKTVQEKNFQIFEKDSRTILNSYNRTINSSILTLNGYLHLFFDMENISHMTNEEIQKDLMSRKINIEYHYNDVFWADNTGMSYDIFGEVQDISGREFFQYCKKTHQGMYVSDPYFSTLNSRTSVAICHTVLDEKKNFRGIIAMEIPVNLIEQIVKGVINKDEGDLLLTDSTGRFMIASTPELFMQRFTFEDENYRQYSSSNLSLSKFGSCKTKNHNGEDVYLFYREIKDTDWILILMYKCDVLDESINSFRKQLMLNAAFFMLLLIILYTTEILILRAIRKKQNNALKIDPLTGLWTRQKFDRETTAIIRANKKYKIMLIDTDIRGFKFINQNYGGKQADQVILLYAKLLSELAQKNNGMVARGYADHFYLFFKINSVRSGMHFFKDSLKEINEKISAFDIPFFPKFGISFLLTTEHNKDKDIIKTLTGQASFAKGTIKDDLTKQYALYNTRLLSKIKEERAIEDNMDKALINKEFYVVYQPKIDLNSEKIVGAEALVRWNSPELGLMGPNKFIDLFEKNSFVKKLDFYVYETVFKFIRKRLDEEKPVVPISVNMSRNHSKPEKFMHDFLELMNKYEIPPQYVQVEILERSALTNNIMQEITNMLHKAGLTVAMDDFGSGESSLNMLTQIPVDVLKFDRSFLLSSSEKDGMDKKTGSFISSLMDLSHNLNKKTVFEGVETEQQRDFLRSINCETVQGFFYSKPLSAEEFSAYIEEHI